MAHTAAPQRHSDALAIQGRDTRIQDQTASLIRLQARVAELEAVLLDCVRAIQSEFDAMGDDWKDQPIMQTKNKILAKARAALRGTK